MPSRDRALRELLLRARAMWRMVRTGLVEGEPVAEVDVSGAPEAVVVGLAAFAAGAVRCVAERLVEAATFLTSKSDVTCRSLELSPGGRAKR